MIGRITIQKIRFSRLSVRNIILNKSLEQWVDMLIHSKLTRHLPELTKGNHRKTLSEQHYKIHNNKNKYICSLSAHRLFKI